MMNQKIQALRGASICAVVVIHTCAVGWGGVTTRPFVNFAVGMFVFLSGILTKKRTDGRYTDLIVRRLRKCLVPYVLWSFLCAVINGSVKTFVPDIFFSRCNGIYYFILVYAQMVILTPIAFKLLDSSVSWIGWLITPITIFLIRYVCVIKNISVGFPFQGELFAFWFLFYYLGLVLRNRYYTIKIDRNIWTRIYGLSLLIQLLEGWIWYKAGNYDMATTQLKLSSILSTTVACIGAFQYFENRKEIGLNKSSPLYRFMILLGDNSFGIYLCHILVWRVFNKIVPEINVFPFSTVLVIVGSLMAVRVGHRITGKYAYLFGL